MGCVTTQLHVNTSTLYVPSCTVPGKIYINALTPFLENHEYHSSTKIEQNKLHKGVGIHG